MNSSLLPRSAATVPPAEFCYRMTWKGFLVDAPDYFTWSHCGVQGPDGRVHLFGERIAGATIRRHGAHIAWGHFTCAEIAHYVADDPEGPYRFVDVPLPRGAAGDFDPSMIYPTVHRDGDRWVMLYNGIAAVGDGHLLRGGLAVAEALDGPWRKAGMVLEPSPDPGHFSYQAAIHVPTLLPFRGRWFAYFHTGPGSTAGYGLPDWGPDGSDCIGVAVADRPEGPWRILEEPAFRQPHPGQPGRHVTVEDVGAFVRDDRVYLLCSDFFGHVTGVVGGLALFASDDGVSFPFADARLAADLIPAYCADCDPARATVWWEPGRPNRLEAPRVLTVDGRPAYLLAGSGTNVAGGPNTVSYLLQMNW